VTDVTTIFPAVRAVILSHTYANPAARGKLHALAGAGAALAVAVPAVWRGPASSDPVSTPFGEDSGVRVVPIPTRGRDPEGAPGSWEGPGLRRLLTDFRPDIVQVEEEPSTRVAAAVSRMAHGLGIPTVVFTAESLKRDRPFLARLRRRRTLSRAGGVLGTNSIATALAREEFPVLAGAAIPQMGLPVPRELAREPHPALAIGFVGRLVPEKGLDLLFKACVRVYGAWTLTIAGTGPEQERLEALAERLGIASRITWLGGVSPRDLEGLWPRLDCLVAPSRATAGWIETHPRQVLEAMSHGVAVVVSDTGALPETVGGAGLVFGDGHVDGLTDALGQLLADAALRDRLAAEGRRRVIAEYVDDAIARKTMAFWQAVREQRPRSR